MRAKALLIVSCAVIAALPAIAQQAAPQPPSPTTYPPPVTTGPAPAATPQPSTAQPVAARGADDSAVEEVTALNLPPPPPPIEYPAFARRDPWTVGALEPADAGLSGRVGAVCV